MMKATHRACVAAGRYPPADHGVAAPDAGEGHRHMPAANPADAIKARVAAVVDAFLARRGAIRPAQRHLDRKRARLEPDQLARQSDLFRGRS